MSLPSGEEPFDHPIPKGEYPHIDGGFIVIGPECFAAHDESVICWKGRNYVPQDVDRSVESQVQDFSNEDELDSCAVPRPQLVDPTAPQ